MTLPGTVVAIISSVTTDLENLCNLKLMQQIYAI